MQDVTHKSWEAEADTERFLESLMTRMARFGIEPKAVHRLRAELDRHRQAEQRLAELYQREQAARVAAETRIETLANSEARYRTLAQSTSFGVWMCDPDGRCIYVSNCILTMTGLTMEQARGFGWTRCLPPEDVEPLLKEWIHCVQTGGQWERQQRIRDRDGNMHTVLSRAQPVRDPSGRITHWVGVNIDVTARRWTEDALRLAEERFRLVAQSISDVIYEWDVGQGWNTWFGDIDGFLGYQPGEFPRTFEAWVARLHPDDRERVMAAVEHTLKTSAFFDEEYRIARKDGSYRIWRDRGRLLSDAHKQLTRWIGSVADVTEQREAEEALRRRERELVTLVENAPDVISRYDKQFRHLYVNPAITRATGMPPERFIGKTNREVGMAGHLWELWESKLRQVFQEAQEANLEFIHPSPTGIRHYEVRFAPEFAPDGSVESVLAIARDVTDLKRVSLERLRLAALVENSPDFIKLSQFDGAILFLNAGGRRLVGLDHDAPPPHITEFLFPHDRPFLIQTVIPTVLREGRWTGEFNFRHFRTGEPIAMLWDVFRIDDPQTGTPICIATVSRDIRERKRIEQERERLLKDARQAQDQAEAANRAKDHFLAVLSHELRTPLTPALAILAMAQQQADLTSGMRDELQVVRHNIELEAQLIDDLLDTTRITRGKLELHPEIVDAHEKIRAAADIFQREIEAKSLRLVLDLTAKQHHVQADPVRLQQVFWNLISNSVKYTPRQGSITIRSSNEPDGILKVQVTDTGIGIEPEIMQRLFTAFEQGEQTLTRRFGGLGLGLSITKVLVETHGGKLTATSEGKDKGSTFTVELKTVARPPVEPQPPQSPTRRPQRSVRILLVDDNLDTLHVMARLLQAFGHTVSTAASIHEALEAAKEQFDLIISDIGLPDGTGWDLMRTLQERQPVRGIALSGFASDEDAQKSKGAGFVTHLAKPINPEQLETAIQQVAAGAQ